jgi:iron complex transport system permease protein
MTNKQRVVAATLFTVAAIVTVLMSPLLGATSEGLEWMSPASIWSDATAYNIFFLDRLPRVLAGAVVGAGLATAGCVFQAILRNPLAEPFTLGVSSGSSLAAVLAIRVGLDATFLGHSGIGVAALAGAMGTVYIVWRLGRVSAGHPPATLLLAGVTIAMFCSAASMLVQYTADFSEVYRIVRWMMGGLDWIDYGALARAATAILLGIAISLFLARDLNALSAGSDAAASVGVDVVRTSRLAFFISSLMVGAGIAIAGPIGFVGLIVPHALRAIMGPDHRYLIPTSAFVGGGLLVLCDTVARVALAPDQLPVGVVTALIGGPFFLYLLVGEKSRSRLWSG